jgi:hypothetical protein
MLIEVLGGDCIGDIVKIVSHITTINDLIDKLNGRMRTSKRRHESLGSGVYKEGIGHVVVIMDLGGVLGDKRVTLACEVVTYITAAHIFKLRNVAIGSAGTSKHFESESWIVGALEGEGDE